MVLVKWISFWYFLYVINSKLLSILLPYWCYLSVKVCTFLHCLLKDFLVFLIYTFFYLIIILCILSLIFIYFLSFAFRLFNFFLFTSYNCITKVQPNFSWFLLFLLFFFCLCFFFFLHFNFLLLVWSVLICKCIIVWSFIWIFVTSFLRGTNLHLLTTALTIWRWIGELHILNLITISFREVSRYILVIIIHCLLIFVIQFALLFYGCWIRNWSISWKIWVGLILLLGVKSLWLLRILDRISLILLLIMKFQRNLKSILRCKILLLFILKSTRIFIIAALCLFWLFKLIAVSSLLSNFAIIRVTGSSCSDI